MFETKRSELDLIYELLSVASVEIKKTRLMYKTNMTHAQITKYLNKLVELDVINEKNDAERTNCILSQPHDASYLSSSYRDERISINKTPLIYSPKIIRKDTALPLTKQIAVFKKFEEIIKGGVMFNSNYNSKETPLEDHLNTLFKSKLHAFSIKNSTS